MFPSFTQWLHGRLKDVMACSQSRDIAWYYTGRRCSSSSSIERGTANNGHRRRAPPSIVGKNCGEEASPWWPRAMATRLGGHLWPVRSSARFVCRLLTDSTPCTLHPLFSPPSTTFTPFDRCWEPLAPARHFPYLFGRFRISVVACSEASLWGLLNQSEQGDISQHLPLACSPFPIVGTWLDPRRLRDVREALP